MNISISLMGEQLGTIRSTESYDDLNDLAEAICSSNWCPALFKSEKRLNSEFLSSDICVLDIDDGPSILDAKRIFDSYSYIITTTRNHNKPKGKTGKVADRYRVVLFLSECITDSTTYRATLEHLLLKFNFADQACKDPARFFYKSESIYAIKEVGDKVSPETIDLDTALQLVDSNVKVEDSEFKGKLSRATLECISLGIPDGEWHFRFVKAVYDCKEQNYTEEECIELLQKITGELDKVHDLKTIKDIYSNRITKYEARIEEDPEMAEQKSSIISCGQLFNEAFEYLSDKDKVMGEPTGLPGLDEMLGGGFRTGEITVLMAQAKTGKNTLYHYLIHSALMRNEVIGYASRELTPATDVMPDLWSIALGQQIFKMDLNDAYKEKIRKITKDWRLYFCSGYGYIDPSDLHKWMTEMKSLGAKNLWMDHLHYMLIEPEEHKEASKLIKNLKTWAKELDVHINLIVQPNKLQEGTRISLNTLKGGSAIGQALDNLLIMERYDDPMNKNISRLKLEVARHKLATPGEIYLRYNKNDSTFTEMDIDTDPQVLAPDSNNLLQQTLKKDIAKHKLEMNS